MTADQLREQALTQGWIPGRAGRGVIALHGRERGKSKTRTLRDRLGLSRWYGLRFDIRTDRFVVESAVRQWLRTWWETQLLWLMWWTTDVPERIWWWTNARDSRKARQLAKERATSGKLMPGEFCYRDPGEVSVVKHEEILANSEHRQAYVTRGGPIPWAEARCNTIASPSVLTRALRPVAKARWWNSRP